MSTQSSADRGQTGTQTGTQTDTQTGTNSWFCRDGGRRDQNEAGLNNFRSASSGGAILATPSQPACQGGSSTNSSSCFFGGCNYSRRCQQPGRLLRRSAPALTSSRNLSASAARPAATHWKEAFCPALTSSSPSLEKCGALSKETEGGREKSAAIRGFYYLSATRNVSQSMSSSKGLFPVFVVFFKRLSLLALFW